MNRINLGSGKNYLPEFINIDIDAKWKPDIVCDLSASIPRELKPESFDEIRAYDVLEHIPNLIGLMTNLLKLLKVGGHIYISVPYDLSLGAWQDPTHIRAFNENSWLYYTEWFWYLGWKDYRFKLEELNYAYSSFGVSIANRPLTELLRTPRAIDTMLATLVKVETTQAEKFILTHYIK